MRKFMKGCAITALILLVLGVGLAVVAGAVTGTATVSEVLEAVTHGKVHVNLGAVDDWGVFVGEEDEVLYDISESMIFDGLYDILKGDVERYSLEGDVRELNLEVGGCVLFLEESDDSGFYVEATNTGKFQCYVKGGTLYVKSTRSAKHWDDIKKCEITLYIPKDYSFDSVEISFGAGLLESGSLVTEKAEVEVGAGQITLDSLRASKCSIEVGAGNIEISDMNVNKLEAEVGVGQLTAEGSILEKADIECAMGNVELVLNGSEEDFDYNLQAAMGNINIGGASYSGVGYEKELDNHADKKMAIECSMGNVGIYFE